MREAWHTSPQELDPLDWFTGPMVAVTLGGVGVTFSAAASWLVPVSGELAGLEWLFVALLAVATALVSVFTRPGSAPLTWLRALVPVVLGWCAILIASVAYAGQGLGVNNWWPPLGVGLTLLALAPYSSAYRMIVVGSLTTVVTALATVVALGPSPSIWPLFSTLVIGGSTTALAAVAAAVFSFQVVSRISEWSSTSSGPTLSSGVLGEEAKLRILQREVDRVGTRTIPLLRRVATTGRVTPEDRAEANELAAQLRSDLVERANRSWLDTVAPELKLTVLDPEHLADRMTQAQRTALLGLLKAGSEAARDPDVPEVIGLRSEPDGSIAVALSIDVRRPEGRRVKLLAPHYLELTPTVDKLQLDAGPGFHLRFTLRPSAKR